MAKLELFLALTVSQAHVSGLSDLLSLITLCHAHTVCWLLTQRKDEIICEIWHQSVFVWGKGYEKMAWAWKIIADLGTIDENW